MLIGRKDMKTVRMRWCCRQRHLTNIYNGIDTEQVDKNKCVINLSSRPLGDTKVSLDSEQADTVRRTGNVILQQAKPPKPNSTKDTPEAFKNLK